MALNGSISVQFTEWDSLKFSWSATQSITDNTSTVGWKLELIAGKYGRISSSAAKAYTIVVDGNTYSGTNYIGIDNNATKTLASGTTIIRHNDDGARSFNFSFSQAIKITFGGESIGTKSGSGSGVLDDIPRYATLVNAPDFRHTSIPQIQISNPLGKDVEELKMCIALDESGSNLAVDWQDIPKDDVYYEVNITEAERRKLAEAVVGGTSAPIYYILSSTIGGVPQQSTPLKRTYSIEGTKPLIFYTVSDSNTDLSKLTGSSTKFIKFYSNLSYVINARGEEYAIITDVSATYMGTTKTTATGSFDGIDTDTITFTATDNRLQTTTETVPLDIVPYVKLSCDLSVSNPTADGIMTLKIMGNYYNGSFGAQNNTLALQYRIKEGANQYGDWEDVDVGDVTGNSYNSITVTIDGLNYRSKYVVQARAKDAVNLEGIYSKEIPVKSLPSFDWGENDFNFNVPVHMNGNRVLSAQDDKSIVLSAEGADIYICPNGSATDEGQLKITTDGRAILNGVQMATINDIPAMPTIITPTDYVIDQGNDSSYAYIKWASGRLEAWRTDASSVPVMFNMSYGSSWYNNTVGTLTTTGNASQFVSVQNVQLTLMSNAGMPAPNIRTVVIENGVVNISYYMVNPVSVTLNITPNVYIIGTWK